MNYDTAHRLRSMLRLHRPDTHVIPLELHGRSLVLVGAPPVVVAYQSDELAAWADAAHDRRCQIFDSLAACLRPVACEHTALELWRRSRVVLHGPSKRPLVPAIMLYADELATQLVREHRDELAKRVEGPWIAAVARVYEYVRALPNVCLIEAAPASVCVADQLREQGLSLRALREEAAILQEVCGA